MTGAFQSGQHPDADQLTALMEQALPAHEREAVLAHLAVCAECRETVVLALPAEAEPAPAHAAAPSPRRWWLTGWRLAYPAAALAAGVFAMYLAHEARMQKVQTTPQVAVAHAPARPESNASHADLPAGAAKKEDRAATNGSVVAGSGLLSRSAEAYANQDAKEARRAMAARLKDEKSADSLVADARSSTPAAPQAAPLPEAKASPAPEDSLVRAPAPTPPAQAELGGGQQLALNTENARGNFALTKPAQMNAFLRTPSAAPVLSVATHEKQVLVVDRLHKVYLSNNSGATWRAIPASWNGDAIAATLVTSPPSPAQLQALDKNEWAYQGAPPVAGQKNNQLASGGPVNMNQLTLGGASISGTVLDATGAVISNASVAVTDSKGAVVRTARSDQAGKFEAGGLAPGTYSMKTTSPGFQEQLTQGIALAANRPAIANVELSVGASAQTVSVTSAEPSLDVERDRQAYTIDGSKVTARAKKQKAAASPAAEPVFEITTNRGEHWVSADGVQWTRR